ncbi:hypothetical protein M885DRAFT_500565 [Pelagophyceae sp. CCMP2097]|nr:hypothetical protein M885DRAFT_500565 [Pelagophyceae sp. CCMP2097]
MSDMWAKIMAASKPGAQRGHKVVNKPPGPVPKHKMWDSKEGCWIEDPDNPAAPAPALAKRSVGRPWKRPLGVDAQQLDRSARHDEDEQPVEQRPAMGASPAPVRRAATVPPKRKFCKAWRLALPWLIFAKNVGVDVGGICPCSEGEKCEGCSLCGRLMCTLYMERDTLGLVKGDLENPLVVGSSNFYFLA